MTTNSRLPVPQVIVPPYQPARPMPARPQHIIVPLLNSLPATLMTNQGVIIYGSRTQYVQRNDNGEWMGIYRFRYFDQDVRRYIIQDAIFEVAWSGTKLRKHKLFPARFG